LQILCLQSHQNMTVSQQHSQTFLVI